MSDEAEASPPMLQRVILGKNPVVTLLRIVILVIVVFVTFKFVLAPIKVVGISMEPTFRNGKICVVNRLAYRARDPERGDVVAVKTTGESVLYLKRIVGLPGETIRIGGGVIYIDEEPLEEPYVSENQKAWFMEGRTLDESSYFVIGDNRDTTFEGHSFGIPPREKILGKVIR